MQRWAAVLLVLLIFPFAVQQEIYTPGKADNLRCLVCLRGHHPRVMSLSAGFNYELLKAFASSMASEADIQTCDSENEALRMVAQDGADIAILPYSEPLYASEGYRFSDVMTDNTLWVFNADDRDVAESFNRWFSVFRDSREYKALKARFSPTYDPFKRIAEGGDYPTASPYDDLIRKYARSIGWDWRMLAALIWKESSFRIEEKSASGAEGLLQMLPSTARRFHNDDMLDPERNLGAGVDYIGRLKKMFAPHVEESDLTKFVLAAYSAGEGRVLDCIRYARAHEIPCSTWEGLKSVIDTLREYRGAATDTLLKYKGLRGYQTINYVSTVYSIYDAFMVISPGPSSQDQPATQRETESEEEALSQDMLQGLPESQEQD